MMLRHAALAARALVSVLSSAVAAVEYQRMEKAAAEEAAAVEMVVDAMVAVDAAVALAAAAV